jgi:tRNA(Ile)-lysidine synthase
MLDKHYNKLALGHHMDDNAEHMLMAILRGAGPRGLSGIAPVRENRIIRPLINARRPHIEAYVQAQKIPCSEDASNADQQIDRNRIRHHLLPLLTSDYNPRVTENLNRLADIMREEAEWTEASVEAAWEAVLLDREHDAITLSSRMLTNVHLALARRLMRKALKLLNGNIRRIGYNHIQGALDMAAPPDGSIKTCHLPDGIRVHRCGHSVNITAGHSRRRRMADAPSAGKVRTDAMVCGPFPTSIVIPGLNMGLRFRVSRPDERPRWSDVGDNRAYLDLDRLHLPLGVRRCFPGDRFTPLGASGTQKVKKYFIDHHIPRHARARTPVLTDRRRIIWLIGQRIDDAVKITPYTSHILEAEVFLIDTR